MDLREYQNKRRFERTPEPSGSAKGSVSGALSFVIHKHNARRLHYDLRLEMGGVLKSWAVPKGPSLNPNDKRLAMMVEDHPFDYGKFEGVIPSGNYGAGEVIIWDRGYYAPLELGLSREEQEKSLKKALQKGHLAFAVYGEKVKGIYDLVKIQAEENSWLLIKRSDDFDSASDITNNDRSVVSGVSINDLKKADHTILDMDTLVKKGIKKSMPKNVLPMLASSTDAPFDRKDWIFEVKWDGYRVIAEAGETVKLYSRNQVSLNDDYPEIVQELKSLNKRMIIDGEVVSLDEKGIPRFQLLQREDQNKGTLMFVVFDILYYDEYDLRELALRDRKTILQNVLKNSDRLIISEHIEQSGVKLFQAAVSAGYEGIMAKDGKGPYRTGRRSEEWLKVKVRNRDEAFVCGFTEGRGSGRPLGAVLLGKRENNKLHYIGHAGVALNEKELSKLRNRLDVYETEQCPFDVIPKANAPVHWLRPELICEVEFTNVTDDGHLRHPIFLGIKNDLILKTDEAEQKTFLDPEEKESVQVGKQVVVLTNLSKIYWPKEKITKGDLVRYYAEVASFLLPHLNDRPQSMLRNPNGIEEPGFFQKNSVDNPDWVKTVPLRSDTEERLVNYIVCNDIETLVYMINLGCIELNPWLSRIGHLDNPDYLVIDIDPHDIDLKYTVETAQVTKALLDELEIPAYCKTSGKAGLHIFCPTRAKYTYEQVRYLSEILVRIVNTRLPKTTSVLRNPKERVGKVYLDYLQNKKGQTIASVYSVRPAPGASVSTPLSWKEVQDDLDPRSFTMDVVQERLKKYGDLWSLGKLLDLEKVMKKLSYEKF